jgi:biopolymer transport protein ExbB
MRTILVIIILLSMPVGAQTPVPEALQRAEADLVSALAELEAVRGKIAKEKPAAAREFRMTELELKEKRRLVRIARMGRDDRAEVLQNLERERALRSQDAAYLAGLLKDHALRIETVSGPGEPRLDLDADMLAREASDPAGALEERLTVVEASLGRLEVLMGGSFAEGEVVSEDGTVVDGRFAAAGPAVFFQGESGVTGDVVTVKGAELPRLWSRRDGEVAALFSGAESVVPVDVTGGKARALEDIEGGAWDYVRKGGLWVWPIILLALVATVIGVVKVLSFAGYREPGEAWVGAVLGAFGDGDRARALELAGDAKHPAGPVMARLLAAAGSSVDVVEETLYEQLMGVQQKASALLPVLAVTAASAPLLGLLGTVSGMIRTFNLITLFGSGDPKPLAGGISEALVTTLFGLVVAIPALILHAFLSRRSQGIVQTTERLGLSFVNGLRKS